MFDYHMHSTVSFDARSSGRAMAEAAKAAGLKEICFTDHLDYDPLGEMGVIAFDPMRLDLGPQDKVTSLLGPAWDEAGPEGVDLVLPPRSGTALRVE